MGNMVYTETKCERCGESNIREGAEGFVPPVDWAEVDLSFRGEGSGWENNRRVVKTLCPKCAKAVEEFMEG